MSRIEAGVVELTPDCRHHWVIESPSGPTSQGKCRSCGIIRTFKNAFDDLLPSVKTAEGTLETNLGRARKKGQKNSQSAGRPLDNSLKRPRNLRKK
jgi:hypothetical protein